MKSSRTSIIVILIFGFLLQTFTPVIKSIVETIEYAALSEKEISHEILVEPTSFLEKLGAKDIIKFREFTQKDLLPILTKFDDLDSLIVTSIDNDSLFTSLLLNESTSILSELNRLEQETENNSFKEIIISINYNFNDIHSLIEKTTNSEQLLLPKSKLRNLKNGIFSLVLHILDKGKNDNKAIAIQEYLIHSLGEKSQNLIDDVPYFSLPPEYSQEKEKEIFESIKLNTYNPLALIALTQLYIEMRNITDAQIIFRNYIAPLKNLPEDLRIAKLLTKEQIKEFNSKRINANLIESTVTIKENRNAVIEEEYELIGETLNKEVVVLLPFRKENFAVIELNDHTKEKIKEFDLRNSWKSSTILSIREGGDLKKLFLKYEVSDFLIYDDDFGKFVFRYGGVSTSKRLTCNVNIPTTFAITNLEQSYVQSQIKDEFYKLKWINPMLQYKISPIKYTGVKSGVAGELVSIWLINKRYSFTLLIFVLFLVLTNISLRWLPGVWKSISYLILASIVVVYLMNDIQIVQNYGGIFNNISNLAYRVVFGGLLITFIFLSERHFDGNKYLVTTMCVFEFALVALFMKLYYNNADFNNTILTVIALVSLLLYLDSIASILAHKLEYNKSTLITFIIITFLIFFFVSKNIELFKFSKFTLNIIGYIFGGLILILLSIFFIASERDILNKRNKSFFARIFEWITIKIEPIASDSSKVLLILLIIVTFFFNSAIVAIFIGLVGAFLSDILKNIINYDSIVNKSKK